MQHRLLILSLLAGLLVAGGCTANPQQPAPSPTWSQPNFGGDPDAYGPQRNQPCYGPNCPRR